MRTGEVFALTWDDIDFKNRKILVNKTVYSKLKDDSGRWFLGTTKTESSCREVYLCDTLYKLLFEYRQQQILNKKKYGRSYIKYSLFEIKNKYKKVKEYQIVEGKYKNNINMVFVKDNGKYCGTDIIKYPFKIIHNELEIKNCRFYDLRRTYATICLRNGIEIKDLANILGHNRIETTENYYIYTSDKDRIKASKIIEDIYDLKL